MDESQLWWIHPPASRSLNLVPSCCTSQTPMTKPGKSVTTEPRTQRDTTKQFSGYSSRTQESGQCKVKQIVSPHYCFSNDETFSDTLPRRSDMPSSGIKTKREDCIASSMLVSKKT